MCSPGSAETVKLMATSSGTKQSGLRQGVSGCRTQSSSCTYLWMCIEAGRSLDMGVCKLGSRHLAKMNGNATTLCELTYTVILKS